MNELIKYLTKKLKLQKLKESETPEAKAFQEGYTLALTHVLRKAKETK